VFPRKDCDGCVVLTRKRLNYCALYTSSCQNLVCKVKEISNTETTPIRSSLFIRIDTSVV